MEKLWAVGIGRFLATGFQLISKQRIKEVQNCLNERPGKVLHYRTPKGDFEGMILKKII